MHTTSSTRHTCRCWRVGDGHIAYFTHYVVALDNAKTTKIYKLALEREKDGFLSILTEDLFFNILENRRRRSITPTTMSSSYLRKTLKLLHAS